MNKALITMTILGAATSSPLTATVPSGVNIEIKAVYTKPNFDYAHETARALGATYLGCDHQIDTYFITRDGRFKLRESSLSGAYLVPYIRPDTTEAKKSTYVLIPVAAENVAKTKELFTTLLGVETIVEKKRDIYRYNNVRIHLDEIQGLGRFFELEAVYTDDTPENRILEQNKVAHLLRVFDIAEKDLLSGSYRELIQAK